MYGQDGVLRRQNNDREGKNYEYIHLNGSLIAKVTTVVSPVTPVLTLDSYSNNGSYTVSWNTVAYATSYELQEQVNAGAWAAVYTGSAQSWAASGKSGANYGYRIRACQGTSCSGWSATSNIVVQLPPADAPAISVPPSAPNGNYAVSWTAVSGAATYQLEESSNGGAWVVVQNTAAQSAGYANKAAGTYAYRVRGCNPANCGPASGTVTTTAFYAPTGAPSLSAPALALNGNFTVSWTAVGDAIKYSLEENVNGGGWSVISESSATSLPFSNKPTGNYSYRVRAGNNAGWSSAYSNVVTVASLQPPGTPSLAVPASSNSGSYTVSWTGMPTAERYMLEQSVNGGGWVLIQSDGSTSRPLNSVTLGTYAYRVQACNGAGCSGYSNTGTISVTPPPPTPTIISSTKFQWKQGTLTKIRCDHEWTASPGATNYDFVVTANGLVQYSGPLTKISAQSAAYCAPAHIVRACNASGCSAYSPSYEQGFVDLDNPQ
jgi:hypothetical protein